MTENYMVLHDEAKASRTWTNEAVDALADWILKFSAIMDFDNADLTDARTISLEILSEEKTPDTRID